MCPSAVWFNNYRVTRRICVPHHQEVTCEICSMFGTEGNCNRQFNFGDTHKLKRHTDRKLLFFFSWVIFTVHQRTPCTCSATDDRRKPENHTTWQWWEWRGPECAVHCAQCHRCGRPKGDENITRNTPLNSWHGMAWQVAKQVRSLCSQPSKRLCIACAVAMHRALKRIDKSTADWVKMRTHSMGHNDNNIVIWPDAWSHVHVHIWW